MATKKKTFDAVREARCWRRLAGKRQAAMTPTEYREYLRRVTEEFLTRKPLPKALAMLRRPIASAPAKKKTFDAVKESSRQDDVSGATGTLEACDGGIFCEKADVDAPNRGVAAPLSRIDAIEGSRRREEAGSR
jgi:hypothetical protein